MSVRKAAVLLHGLSIQDRNWMLANLPSTAADQIKALLKELDQLGIPREKSVINAALETAKMVDAQRSIVCRINEYDFQNIYAGLRGESLCFVRRILSAHSWRWDNDVKNLILQSMTRRDGKEFVASLHQSRLPPKLELVLLQSFLDKLKGLETGALVLTKEGG